MTDEGWRVLVFEETFRRRRELTQEYTVDGDENAARVRGWEVARGYSPEHPFAPVKRQVYQTSPDGWVVKMVGKMDRYYFEVSVARMVLERDS